jgi:hypothetical protein
MASVKVNTKKLVMVFGTDGDKNVSLSIDKPKASLKETEIKTAMETIVAQNIFAPNGEDLIKCVEAKIVNTNTDEYDLA